MTGFHVRPDALTAHADAVAAIANTVDTGAKAETAGTAQADFGILIGNTIGFGIRAVSSQFHDGLAATAKALHGTADQLHTTASGYQGADDTSAQQATASGDGL